MIFNSIEFLLFWPVVFSIYWTLGRQRSLQNCFILMASYFFYGWWDYRFLGLILLSSLIDFGVGIQLGRQKETAARRSLLGLSLIGNLGMLFVFKYYNFFAESLNEALLSLGYQASFTTLSIVLPVGISFYTFQTLSYSLDVYHGKIVPCLDPIAFFAYVAFFPQLVAGPIERASHLLPQFLAPREFSSQEASHGVRQIVWGFFKKVVVADSAGRIADLVFADPGSCCGPLLVGGAVAFAVQIYGDFSGYSDIAIGTARLLGFRLMKNFAYPYFSRDIAEFWRRWHISLTTWFRDYLYIPIGGSRGGKWRTVRNVFIVFLVSGAWHGANWTFIIWGLLNALYFLPLLLNNKNRRYLESTAKSRIFPSLGELGAMLFTFSLTCLAWIFFRSTTVGEAFVYLSGLPSQWSLSALADTLTSLNLGKRTILYSALASLVLFAMDWIQREKEHGLDIAHWRPSYRWLIYHALFISVLWNFQSDRPFIYFQF
jgi:alginate O-acetyltransferase complex protein AlgI